MICQTTQRGFARQGAVALLSLLLALPAAASVNKSIKIGPGETANGASSVNGSVTVGANAVVSGSVDTVNGTIRIEDNARVEDVSTVNGALRLSAGVSAGDLDTVNGSIRVADGCQIDGSVQAVNGSISLARSTRVSRDIGNVNGSIELTGAEVGGDLETVNGDVELMDGAILRGNLIIEKPGGWGWNNKKRKPRIIVGPGSIVEGTIELEREVELYISDSARVGGVSGVMSLDDAERFSGARP
ncbi:MAG: hypothetical protein AAGE85_11600 [Pseudomonadota bacterium]